MTHIGIGEIVNSLRHAYRHVDIFLAVFKDSSHIHVVNTRRNPINKVCHIEGTQQFIIQIHLILNQSCRVFGSFPCEREHQVVVKGVIQVLNGTAGGNLHLGANKLTLAVVVSRVDTVVIKAFLKVGVGEGQFLDEIQQFGVTIDFIPDGRTAVRSVPSEHHIVVDDLVGQIADGVAELRHTTAARAVDGEGLCAAETAAVLVDNGAVVIGNGEAALLRPRTVVPSQRDSGIGGYLTDVSS